MNNNCNNHRLSKSAMAVAVVIGIILLVSKSELLSYLRVSSSYNQPNHQSRRKLLWMARHISSAMYDHVQPLSVPPQPDEDTALFWHIPKSGGTTVKEIYKCMRLVMTVRVGVEPGFGHDQDNELVVFEPGNTGMLTVNVDTMSPSGILRAEKMNLVPSGLADLIVTTNINFAIEHLFDPEHKGRVFSVFRNPIERYISLFYYVQQATWERSYNPRWHNMSLFNWAQEYMINDYHVNTLTKSLSKKNSHEEVNETDLRVAMRTVSRRIFVGLIDNMEESIHRFNYIMGVDESSQLNRECIDKYFGHGVKKSNSNSHPKVDESDAAWQYLAERNQYDVRLFEYIVQVFDEQRKVIFHSMQNEVG